MTISFTYGDMINKRYEIPNNIENDESFLEFVANSTEFAECIADNHEALINLYNICLNFWMTHDAGKGCEDINDEIINFKNKILKFIKQSIKDVMGHKMSDLIVDYLEREQEEEYEN